MKKIPTKRVRITVGLALLLAMGMALLALWRARRREARERERRGQARQLIVDHQVKSSGERAYRFDVDGGLSYLFEAAKAYISGTTPDESRERHAEVKLNGKH